MSTVDFNGNVGPLSEMASVTLLKGADLYDSVKLVDADFHLNSNGEFVGMWGVENSDGELYLGINTYSSTGTLLSSWKIPEDNYSIRSGLYGDGRDNWYSR